MKIKTLTLATLLLTLSGWAGIDHHLDPQMGPEEYRILLKQQSSQKFIGKKENSIEEAITYGNRLSLWLKVINEGRTVENTIKLTTANNRGAGVPIEKPYIYSGKIVEDKSKEIITQLPQSMRDIITGKSPLTKQLEMSDQEFTKEARKIYGLYSMAARYKLLNPSKELLVGQERRDVRGHYYLTKNKIDAQALNDINSFPKEKLEETIDALIKICQNDWKSRKSCEKKVQEAIKKNKVVEHYNKYFPIASKNWDTFFKIKKDAKRNDISWSESETFIPFTTPKSQAIKDFVQQNIEDEYRFKDWSLKLSFYYSGPTIEFQKGVTAHVNKLGGDRIVMDANSSLDEFDSQWTLRHEFGHVLGLPDCYHEFYDTKIEAYVNYQIDVNDLMCSRSGNMNERIFKELKRTYQ
jgi:hypothetical protein